mgnify:CR=1 FL=1
MVHRALSDGNGAEPNTVEVVETNRRGHATRYAQDAARRGIDIVIGFGGDGTLNEVATGVAGSDTALGVLPGGSTNVFGLRWVLKRTAAVAFAPERVTWIAKRYQSSAGLMTKRWSNARGVPP